MENILTNKEVLENTIVPNREQAIVSDELVFEPCAVERGKHWSNIVCRGKIIGALLERERGLLAPIETTHQICVPEELVDDSIYSYDTEDKGLVFACFTEVEDFVVFYNKKILNLTDVKQMTFAF